ncbi:MAG TPA: GntR family transcriptional regulator [Gemmataceae bacterium]|nr:GntR family transcriptional regulator [Gemmataceae bacterium]
MFDIQHDSPVPIHVQITGQIRAHVASGALKAGARLAEYRAFAQALLANPQVVARAYEDLEQEGVLAKSPGGGMEVTAGASVICRLRLQDIGRERIRQAVAQSLALGLAEAEIVSAVEQELAAARARPLSPDELLTAIKKPTHERSHRDSQGIQDLSRQSRPRSP